MDTDAAQGASSRLSLACPRCRHEIMQGGDCYHCPQCGATYPQVQGIPDLRHPDVPRDPEEQEVVARLLRCYPHMTLPELVAERMKMPSGTYQLQPHERLYLDDNIERGRRFFKMFHERLVARWGPPASRSALDVGCGIGTSLVAMAGTYQEVIGLDARMPELLLAQKNLEEQGIVHYRLVQGHAQCLPFAAGSFDYVNAVNTLEHVFDVDTVIAEVHRVLRREGAFCADSRNRFDLLFPEPHVKLRWVGLLPRRWAASYVRLLRNRPYEHTHLLSYWDLASSLRRHFGRSWAIAPPTVAAYGQPAQIDRLVATLERVPALRTVLLWFFPSHLVLARRSL